jgi:competence protein ComEA
MPSFTKKQQIAILIVGILLVFLVGTRFDFKDEERREIPFEEIELEDTESKSVELDSEEDSGEASDELVVYIKGAVKYPGVVVVEQGTRVADLIEEAGGLDEGTDLNSVNLAKKVQDEEMVHIPYIGEELQTIEKADTGSGSEGESRGSDAGIKIDINTASKEELKTLSGIGEVTAEKIIDYRESKRFKSIEEIMEVSGIGEKKFEAIRDSIIVN